MISISIIGFFLVSLKVRGSLVHKNMRVFNEVILAKSFWQIMHKDLNSLVQQVLKAKYGKGNQFAAESNVFLEEPNY